MSNYPTVTQKTQSRSCRVVCVTPRQQRLWPAHTARAADLPGPDSFYDGQTRQLGFLNPTPSAEYGKYNPRPEVLASLCTASEYLDLQGALAFPGSAF